MRACILLASLQQAQLAVAAEAVYKHGTTCGQIKGAYKASECCGETDKEIAMHVVPAPPNMFKGKTNPCEGKKPTGTDWDNWDCMKNDVVQAIEQAGADVTENFDGGLDTSHSPKVTSYFEGNLCPVNVHWHLGAEHRSAGQYDETMDAKGPGGADRRLGEGARLGFRCNHYDATDAKFTKEYTWLHCDASMKVGETYEVHWPHSAAGSCGTPWQFQTPFYDGVFCNSAAVALVLDGTIKMPDAVGVHGQVFTIVNDESYYYPDMIRGMIIDADRGMGQKITAYTGSTTGTSRSNTVCSKYAPITWQVDRTCHLISASSFDKMCADMKQQADDMSTDLYAHGARELVATKLSANNHVFDASAAPR